MIMLEQWAVFLEVISGPAGGQQAVHELSMLIEAAG